MVITASALALVQQGRTEVWEPGAPTWIYRLGEIGPWLLAAIVLFFVVRALARQRRYRAVAVLGAAEQENVRKALVDVEKRTVGEVLPVVLERSDAHPNALWLCALSSLLVGSALLEEMLPWHAPYWLLLVQIALGAAGFLAARLLPDLQRVFVSEARASEMAGEQALQEFHREHLHETRERTGVLLFVSLFERRVIVLGDVGIDAKVTAADWEKTREAILAGIARGSLAQGLVDGIHCAGELLVQHFPVTAGDVNEVPDRLIVRRE
jgi:putative membrane protein